MNGPERSNRRHSPKVTSTLSSNRTNRSKLCCRLVPIPTRKATMVQVAVPAHHRREFCRIHPVVKISNSNNQDNSNSLCIRINLFRHRELESTSKYPRNASNPKTLKLFHGILPIPTLSSRLRKNLIRQRPYSSVRYMDN